MSRNCQEDKYMLYFKMVKNNKLIMISRSIFSLFPKLHWSLNEMKEAIQLCDELRKIGL